jgi:hypothetical protein
MGFGPPSREDGLFHPHLLSTSSGIVPHLPVSSADQCGKVTYGIPVTGDEDQWIGRVDWVQSARHTLYGRYFIVDYQNPPTYAGKNLFTTTQPGNSSGRNPRPSATTSFSVRTPSTPFTSRSNLVACL